MLIKADKKNIYTINQLHELDHRGAVRQRITSIVRITIIWQRQKEPSEGEARTKGASHMRN
jgi:hypothetical protein